MKNWWLLVLILCFEVNLQSNAQTKLPSIGITGSLSGDSLAAANGFTYLEETVRRILSPGLTEVQFQDMLKSLQQTKCKVQSCNVFIPGEIKLVGPAVDERRVLGYVDSVMQRAKIAGIKIIVLGSGDARRIPEGTDSIAAVKQFIKLGRKMAGIAAKYNVTIAMENLNSGETNFVNTLAQGNAVVSAINHPNFRLTADIYHMLKENESPASIEKAKKVLIHCHIAEREKRTPPGVEGDDFKPYLAALHDIGFSGCIMMECRWTDPAAQYRQAYDYLSEQLKTAYKQ